MLLCRLGLHRWEEQPARFNPARIVRRCRRCYCVSVMRREAVGGEGRTTS